LRLGKKPNTNKLNNQNKFTDPPLPPLELPELLEDELLLDEELLEELLLDDELEGRRIT
jgi:hypothetical protein